MGKTTISDVAKKASVSKSTVSQYLNKRYNYMAEETKQRIEKAIEDLGYQPNYLARSLKQKRTSTIGVIVANILHNFSTQVIRAIEDYSHAHDVHMIVCNADDDPKKEENYINMLRAKQVDGLIIFPTGGNVGLYQRMVKEDYPIVFVDRMVKEVDVDTVLLQNENASYMAMQWFITKGHKEIGIITPTLHQNLTPRIERVEGYKKALSDYGIPINGDYIKSIEITQIQAALETMFSLEKPPSALLAGNDLTLMEILAFIKRKKLKIPNDLSVISIDDVPFADIFDPPLTTISQPAFDIGKKAAFLLLDKIENPEKVRKTGVYRFNPKLTVRSSC